MLNFVLNMTPLRCKNLVVNNNFSQDKFYHIVASYDWNSKLKKFI